MSESKEQHDRLALEYHRRSPSGKIEVVPSKPCVTQRDLSLAYTPGVAAPCLEIARDPSLSAEFTGRANLVGVVTNGSAVLGLGNIGPLASKPVMEGKAVLFKRFAGIDVFDIEVDCSDPDKFIEIVESLGPTFGGINLEDIKAPECFYIERELRKRMNIPVFHDDQHGTAIIAGAALLNALELQGKTIEQAKIVFSGAGAAAMAVGGHLVKLGATQSNITFTDKDGVIYKGRPELDPIYEDIAQETEARTLQDVLPEADVFIGLSVGGILKPEMIRSMADKPIVFALANPTPEIHYAEAKESRPDVIVATGRSDYPNQVNNVLGFPYIFRGALDCGATTVTIEMELAASRAIAELAREVVPDSVRDAYGGETIQFGPEYLIPKPVDQRVLLYVAPAVAAAAAESGVATRPIEDMQAYRDRLAAFLGRTKQVMAQIENKARQNPKKLVFPEGERKRILRAAHELVQHGICHPVLLGETEIIEKHAIDLQIPLDGIEVIDPKKSDASAGYATAYYGIRHRRGVTPRSSSMAMQDPILYGMMMVRTGDADGLVAGVSMNYPDTIRPALQIIGLKPGRRVTAGMYMMLQKERTLFFADTTVNIDPDPETLAEIALMTAEEVRRFDVEPKIAMLSFSNFGSNEHPQASKVRKALKIIRERAPNLVVEGEMQVDPALDPSLAREEFPFSAIQGDANVLVFPELSSANMAYKLMMHAGGAEAVGPILLGMDRPITVCPRGASAEAVFNMAAYTVMSAD